MIGNPALKILASVKQTTKAGAKADFYLCSLTDSSVLTGRCDSVILQTVLCLRGDAQGCAEQSYSVCKTLKERFSFYQPL